VLVDGNLRNPKRDCIEKEEQKKRTRNEKTRPDIQTLQAPNSLLSFAIWRASAKAIATGAMRNILMSLGINLGPAAAYLRCSTVRYKQGPGCTRFGQRYAVTMHALEASAAPRRVTPRPLAASDWSQEAPGSSSSGPPPMERHGHSCPPPRPGP
jgi:hypothetical protein